MSTKHSPYTLDSKSKWSNNVDTVPCFLHHAIQISQANASTQDNKHDTTLQSKNNMDIANTSTRGSVMDCTDKHEITRYQCNEPDCEWEDAETIPSHQFHTLSDAEKHHIQMYHKQG